MGYSEKEQGYNQNYFYVVEGSFANSKIGRASFGKELERGGSLRKTGKGRGLRAKCPFFFLPATGNRGGAQGRRRPWASGAREKGEKG